MQSLLAKTEMATLRDANPLTIGDVEVGKQGSISCEDFMLLDRVSFGCHQAMFTEIICCQFGMLVKISCSQ